MGSGAEKSLTRTLISDVGGTPERISGALSGMFSGMDAWWLAINGTPGLVPGARWWGSAFCSGLVRAFPASCRRCIRYTRHGVWGWKVLDTHSDFGCRRYTRADLWGFEWHVLRDGCLMTGNKRYTRTGPWGSLVRLCILFRLVRAFPTSCLGCIRYTRHGVWGWKVLGTHSDFGCRRYTRADLWGFEWHVLRDGCLMTGNKRYTRTGPWGSLVRLCILFRLVGAFLTSCPGCIRYTRHGVWGWKVLDAHSDFGCRLYTRADLWGFEWHVLRDGCLMTGNKRYTRTDPWGSLVTLRILFLLGRAFPTSCLGCIRYTRHGVWGWKALGTHSAFGCRPYTRADLWGFEWHVLRDGCLMTGNKRYTRTGPWGSLVRLCILFRLVRAFPTSCLGCIGYTRHGVWGWKVLDTHSDFGCRRYTRADLWGFEWHVLRDGCLMTGNKRYTRTGPWGSLVRLCILFRLVRAFPTSCLGCIRYTRHGVWGWKVLDTRFDFGCWRYTRADLWGFEGHVLRVGCLMTGNKRYTRTGPWGSLVRRCILFRLVRAFPASCLGCIRYTRHGVWGWKVLDTHWFRERVASLYCCFSGCRCFVGSYFKYWHLFWFFCDICMHVRGMWYKTLMWHVWTRPRLGCTRYTRPGVWGFGCIMVFGCIDKRCFTPLVIGGFGCMGQNAGVSDHCPSQCRFQLMALVCRIIGDHLN